MVDNYYKLRNKNKSKKKKKTLGIFLILIGIFFFLYSFLPIISWQIYFAKSFAEQKIDSPIPFTNLISYSAQSFGKNYYDAASWYSNFVASNKKVNYTISIPNAQVTDANVSNTDTDLSKHLVQFNSDSYPGTSGNVVIFGHSTLPQLFKQTDYKTIFSTLYKLKVGDTINITYQNKRYTYQVVQSLVVEPDDTSVLGQDFSGSTLTLITCTPPGTVWKRLIIKAKLI